MKKRYLLLCLLACCGLLALAGMLVYLALLSGMEKQSAKIAPKRQRDEARLVEAVLEAAPPQAARLKAIPAAITKDTMRSIVFSP